MSQNIYDNPDFFAGYATLPRSAEGAGQPAGMDSHADIAAAAGRKISAIDPGCRYGWFCRWAKEQGAARDRF